MKRVRNGKNHFSNWLLPWMFFILSAFPFFQIAAQQNPAEAATAAQNARNIHQWGAISSFHGLPSDRVYAIAQTADGVMWFGTERGLARYDGRRVQTIGLPDALLANRVLALKRAPDGALWIGTERGAAIKSIKNEFRLIEQTAGKAISAIIISPERQSVILATLAGQIFECRLEGENAWQVRPIPVSPILAADREPQNLLQMTSLAVRQNVLLVGSRQRGLLHFDKTAETLGEVIGRPRPFFINALESDANGDLWLGADAARNESGLYLANNVLRLEKVSAPTGAVTALASVGKNDLWVGTKERGAFHFRNRQQLENFTFENTSGGLRSNNILTVFVDRENVTWFGTDKGVFRFDPNAPHSELVAADPESNFVRTLYKMREGRIFAGTNRGLFSVDENHRNWHENRDFIGKTIFGVAESRDGQLLVGTANGLFVNGRLQSSIDSGGKQTNESVRAIRQFQNKIYLAIFGRGVERIDNDSRTIVFPVRETDQALREITALEVEGDQRLWIGTARRGVFAFDGNGFSQDAVFELLKGAPVRAISGNLQNGLWFATEKGLWVYQNGKLENVLPNISARSVYLESSADGQTSVWSATEQGLFHVKFDAEWGWLVARLEVEQGLPSQNIFAVLPEANNNLIVGTNRGIVRYVANRVKPLLVPTRVLSQRLHAPEELASGIRLDYPQNSLALEVAAQSSRTFPEQFQYAFKLRDENGQIVKKSLSTDSQFLMENLKAGTYIVEAAAFDKDLQASEPLVFNFTIAKAPFPWTAATLGSLLAVALVTLVLVVWQRDKIRRTSRQLVTARFDLANEAERERRRIARDLHDQTLADLRHLMISADKFDDANQETARFRAEIENVSQEIRRICEDLSPSVLENIGLAAALEWVLQTTALENKLEFEFVCDNNFEENLKLAPSVQIQIYRIAQEVLSNISRHAAASSVKLTLANSNNLVLTIEDDGRSFEFSPKSDGHGRGLKNIAARASLIDAHFAWEKRAPKGNVFWLRLAHPVVNHNA